MGHVERKRIINTINFVEQLGNLRIPSGCFQAAILAMGGKNIQILDVIKQYEQMTGVQNVKAYLYNQGLGLGGSFEIKQPLSLSQTRKILESPRVIITELDYKHNSGKRVAGILFAFGEYEKEPPHVVGVLPRGDMSKNLRQILKHGDAHVVVDTSQINRPIYPMKTTNIAENLNAFILNDIDVSLHIITR